jgi:putative DNA primase/helicase
VTDEAVKQAALAYAARGWHVVPLHGIQDGTCTCLRGPECESPGKHPRTRNGLKDATTNQDDVDYFFDQYPNSNVGIVCGPSELAVVDIDTEDALAKLEEHLGLNPKEVSEGCPIVKTARGYHIFYHDPEGTTRPKVGRGAHAGIDLRAGESYVVAPPSTHHTGHVYEWVRE